MIEETPRETAIDDNNLYHLAQHYLSTPSEFREQVEEFFEAAELAVMESKRPDSGASTASLSSLIPTARTYYDIAYAINRILGPVIDATPLRRFVVDPKDINSLQEFVIEVVSFETFQVAEKSLVIKGATAELDWSKVPKVDDVVHVAKVFNDYVSKHGHKPKREHLKGLCGMKTETFSRAYKAVKNGEIIIPIVIDESLVTWGEPIIREQKPVPE